MFTEYMILIQTLHDAPIKVNIIIKITDYNF